MTLSEIDRHIFTNTAGELYYSAYALIVTPLIDTFALIDTLFWVIFLPP